jgi:hypothetical protein
MQDGVITDNSKEQKIMSAITKFNKSLDFITNVVNYNPAWANGTGYFNGATSAEVEVGALVKALANDGRTIVLIGTPLGTVAIFPHHTYPEIVTINAPRALQATGIMYRENSHLSAENIEFYLGVLEDGSETNLGFIVQAIYDSVAETKGKKALAKRAAGRVE